MEILDGLYRLSSVVLIIQACRQFAILATHLKLVYLTYVAILVVVSALVLLWLKNY